MTRLHRFATFTLMTMERFYLRVHGWNQVGPDAWDPPADYPFESTRKKKGLRQGHAVNSQKQLMYHGIRERISSSKARFSTLKEVILSDLTGDVVTKSAKDIRD
jgi:hypothetical protein